MEILHIVKTRGLLWAVTHSGFWLFDRFFELALYPFMIVKYGVLLGTGIMMLLSFFICLAFLIIYDHVSTHWVRDMLGYETLKDAWNDFEIWLLSARRTFIIAAVVIPLLILAVAYISSPALLWTVITVFIVLMCAIVFSMILGHLGFPVGRKSLPFFYFSLFWDPMTTVIMLRPANQHFMRSREWGIFIASVIVSNVAWALIVWAGVESFQELISGVWNTRN